MTNNLLLAVAERAIKTFVQTLVAVVGTGYIFDKEVIIPALATASSAAVLSVLTSIGSMSFGTYGPSLASEAVAPIEEEM